jgi:hypothetical protein
MTQLALCTDEPAVAIVVPVRLLPQLVAILAAAANAAPTRADVETSGESVPQPQRPGITKVHPRAATIVPFRKAGT